jgi:hypothetical protein
MKIGRNEPCPCGSGKKYKRCCAGKTPRNQGKRQSEKHSKVTLGEVIKRLQDFAGEKIEKIQQIGVFLLFSDKNGDAWVLEVTDSDCIQIADSGKAVEVPLEETEETIIVDWSHTFSFKNKNLQITSYKDKETEVLENAPSQQLFAARKKVLKKLSPELLEQVHLDG